MSNEIQSGNKKDISFLYSLSSNLLKSHLVFLTQQSKSSTSPVAGVFPWDAISRWLYRGWEEVETGGQGLAGVFSGHCTQGQTTHQSRPKTANKHTMWKRDSPGFESSFESHEKPPGSEAGDKGEIWHFFMSNSLSAIAVMQSLSDSSGQWSHRWGEKMITGGYKLH